MNIPKIEEAKKKHLEEIEKTMLEIWQPVAGAWNPINTHSPEREWVGLTDEERRELRKRNQQHDALMLATEQLLKEKNNGPR